MSTFNFKILIIFIDHRLEDILEAENEDKQTQPFGHCL